MKYTEEQYLKYKENWSVSSTETGRSYNEILLTLFKSIIEPSLKDFTTQSFGQSETVSKNITALEKKEIWPSHLGIFLNYFNRMRNDLVHSSDGHDHGKEEYHYFKHKTLEFITHFKPDSLPSEQGLEVVEKEEKIYDQNNPAYLGKFGRYNINGEEYISIFGYKKLHTVKSSLNGNDAMNLLKSGISSYQAVPEVGQFSFIRIFPVKELHKYYGSAQTHNVV